MTELERPLVIAVINDEFTKRLSMRKILQHRLGIEGVVVLEGDDGGDGVSLRFGTPVPHLMIVNGLMHQMHGDAAIAAIRRREAEEGWSRVPIVTESTDGWYMEQGMAAGADAELRSPFASEELLRVVRSLLGLPA